MIAIISTVAMFIFFMTGALVHFVNRSSRSYFLIIGYLGAAFLEVVMVGKNGAMNFGLWTFVWGTICLGELIRFHKKEVSIAQRLQRLVKSEEFIVSFEYFSNLPTCKWVHIFGGNFAYVTHKDEHSVSLILRIGENHYVNFTPDNFDLHMKRINKVSPIDVFYRGLVHSLTTSGKEFMCRTSLRVEGHFRSKVELSIVKR